MEQFPKAFKVGVAVLVGVAFGVALTLISCAIWQQSFGERFKELWGMWIIAIGTLIYVALQPAKRS